MTRIETGRLIAKPFSEDDLDMIYRLYSDEEMLKYTPHDTMNMEEAKDHLAQILKNWGKTPLTDLEFLLLSKDGGGKVGRCGINIDAETDSAMIGLYLIKEEWNKGYATEIVNAMMEYCFDALGVHRVYALCNPDNTGSRRVMEKTGMRQEAYFRKKCRYIKNGASSWHDEMLYAILKEER